MKNLEESHPSVESPPPSTHTHWGCMPKQGRDLPKVPKHLDKHSVSVLARKGVLCHLPPDVRVSMVLFINWEIKTQLNLE